MDQTALGGLCGRGTPAAFTFHGPFLSFPSQNMAEEMSQDKVKVMAIYMVKVMTQDMTQDRAHDMVKVRAKDSQPCKREIAAEKQPKETKQVIGW